MNLPRSQAPAVEREKIKKYKKEERRNDAKNN
jgi:hypothetical protein